MPTPSASAYIAVAKARAPSGASSTAAIPATTRHAFTNARVKSWPPVNTSNDGANPEMAFATHAPASENRISLRRPRRSASAITTSDTNTPIRATASARPSASSFWWKVSVTASPFCVRSPPQKLATSATNASAARRAACSVVNGTGGTIGQRRGGGGGSCPSTRARDAGGQMLERAPGREPGLKAHEPAEERHRVVPLGLEAEHGRPVLVRCRGRRARRASCRRTGRR